MDAIDIVQDQETRERDSLIAKATAKAIGPVLTASECEDCGEAIPAARRKAILGVKRCAFCQGQVEA